MADIDSERLTEAIRELNSTLNGLGTTATTGKGQLTDAFNSTKLLAGKGKEAAAALETMGRAVTKLTGQIYKGEQGQKKYADAVDDAATAVAAVTFAMGPLAKVLTVLGLAFVKFFKASTDMGDKLFKSYQDLSRSGAAASDGLKGVFTLMQDFRLSLDDLPQLSAIIQENAEALAMFRGSVYEGARDMGALRRNITKSGLEREFMGLGMTTQEINETLGGFINIYSNLGLLQNKTTKEATAALKSYVFEVDAITKLTGASRREQEAALQQAMGIEQFNVKIQELRERELRGDKAAGKEADSLLRTFQALNKVNPQLAAGFAQMTSGFVGPGSVGAYLASNAEALKAATQEGLSFEQRMEMMGRGVREFIGPDGLGRTMATFGKLNELTGMQIQNMVKTGVITEDFAKKLEAAKTEQERQRLLEAAGIKVMVDSQQADLNSMQSMQGFVEMGVGPATWALSNLAKVVENLTSMLPGGAKRTLTREQVAADRENYAKLSTGQRFMSDMARGVETIADWIPGMGGLAKQAMSSRMEYEAGATKGKTAPAAGAEAPAGAAQTTGDLRVKPGAGQFNDQLSSLAANIQSKLGSDLVRFTAANDTYHQGTNSAHARGKALDFTVSDPSRAAQIAQQIAGISGVKSVRDEYNNPSGRATAGHIHVEALQLGGPAFRGRSYLVGERGPELFTPGSSGAVTSNDALQRAMGAGLDQQIGLARSQLSIGERMISIMERQNQTLSKILQMQQA